MFTERVAHQTNCLYVLQTYVQTRENDGKKPGTYMYLCLTCFQVPQIYASHGLLAPTLCIPTLKIFTLISCYPNLAILNNVS